MVGQTISHYRVLKKIGEGGMGEVYLAEDTRLDRKVALKFLPQYLQLDEVAQKRFVREAKSAAAIDHPFICKIYEPGETEDYSFIAMEYVKGQTLREKLSKGRVSLKETLQIASEVTEALEKAHGEGIVHRDLKPANIMLTPEGHVKVMDFGLAKRLPEAGDVRDDITVALTREGTTLGTLAYMSPEQTRGKAADTRADIFSFGIVLYEMLTGVHPFRRETQAETSNAILNERPPPLDQYTEDTSDILQHTLEKMLAKDPDQRYQSIHEVRTNLNGFLQPTGDVLTVERAAAPGAKRLRWTLALLPLLILAVWFGWWLFRGEVSSVAPGEITSIGVLPLDNLMSDPNQRYFVEGMHEALTLELSKIGALRVISRTSAARYKDSEKLLPEIAKELDVDALVEGSVLRSEDQVRITLQLVAFEPERHFWSNSYDRELSDILTLYSEVAQTVATEIRVAVTPDDQARLATSRKVNLHAYDAYLKGRFCWNKWTPEGMEQSTEYFRQSIDIDPDYAPSWAGLSMSLRFPVILGVVRGRERLPIAHEAALRAVVLDSSSAEARASLGMGRCLGWNWVECEQDFQQALELDSNYAHGHHVYANLYLLHMGRLDEALAEIQRARELDPFSLPNNVVLAKILYYRREYDQSIEQFGATIDLDPGFAAAHLFLGDSYREKGMLEDAVETQEKAVALSKNSWFLGHLGSTYAVSGRRTEALKLLEELEQQRTSQYVAPHSIAMIYTSLGEIDRAFEWLDKAFEEQDINLPFFIADPLSDSLREDSRYARLLRKLNLPEEAIQRDLSSQSGS